MDGHVMKRVTTPKLFSTVYLVHWCRNGARPATDNNSLGEIYHRRRLGKQRSNSRLFFPARTPWGNMRRYFTRKQRFAARSFKKTKFHFSEEGHSLLVLSASQDFGPALPLGELDAPKVLIQV